MIGVLLSSDDLNLLRGAKWRLWSYTCTHDHLKVQVTTIGDVDYYLDLLMCYEIRAPALCHLHEPSCVQLPDGFLAFRDRDLEIICQEVRLDARDV
jgi:hypothetical protein